MNDFNVFDKLSRIRDLSSSEDKAAIESLPDDHRKVLFECIAAVTSCAEHEDAIRLARDNVRRLEAIYNDAVVADRKANMPVSQHSAQLRAIAANAGRKAPEQTKHNPKTGKEEPVTVNEKIKRALAKSELALTEARATLNRLTHALPPLQLASGSAINAWRTVIAPDAQAVARQYQESGNQERARAAAENPITPGKTKLDEAIAARGRSNPFNPLPAYRGPGLR